MNLAAADPSQTIGEHKFSFNMFIFCLFIYVFPPSVLDDQQNVRPIKELLQMLYISLCALVQDMGKSVLVGNINIWVHRMENIMQWQQQLDNIQINRVSIQTKHRQKKFSCYQKVWAEKSCKYRSYF